jgi:hypothetical protein
MARVDHEQSSTSGGRTKIRRRRRRAVDRGEDEPELEEPPFISSTRKSYVSAEAAKTALVRTGYTPAFSSPGRPQLWVKSDDPANTKERFAVARIGDVHSIVKYPEPAVIVVKHSVLPVMLTKEYRTSRPKALKKISEHLPDVVLHWDMQDPGSKLLLDMYDAINAMEDRALSKLIQELSGRIIKPTKESSYRATAKRLMHDALGIELSESEVPLAALRRWPKKEGKMSKEFGSKMATKTKATTKKVAKKKKTSAKKAAVEDVSSEKASVKKTSAKKTPAKKTSVKKTSVKKTPAKKTSVKKTSVKKTSAKKTPAKKTASTRERRTSVADDTILSKVKDFDGGVRGKCTAMIAKSGVRLSSLCAEAKKRYEWEPKKTRNIVLFLLKKNYLRTK